MARKEAECTLLDELELHLEARVGKLADVELTLSGRKTIIAVLAIGTDRGGSTHPSTS